MDGPGWEAPSVAASNLIRDTVIRLGQAPDDLLAEVDAAVRDVTGAAAPPDPALAAAVSHANRANIVHWAQANHGAPGLRVPPSITPINLDFARFAVRHGYEEALLGAYRDGQAAAWRYWMRAVLEAPADIATLREALDITSRSMDAYVADTVAALRETVRAEREHLAGRVQAERDEAVALILDGAPIAADRASERLRYHLARRHTALILWRDTAPVRHEGTAPVRHEGTAPVRHEGTAPVRQGDLERAAEALAEAAGASRPLVVPTATGSLWVWLPTDRDADVPALRDTVRLTPGVCAAAGLTLPGIDGFRRSHLQARAAQRIMHRPTARKRFASYRELRVVDLASGDDGSAREFATAVLGDLAAADPLLRRTLRVYLAEGSSATRAAKALFAHRNTVLNRIERARALLPEPLDGRALEVGLALELARWLL